MKSAMPTEERRKAIARVGVCILYLYSMLYTFALPVMYPSMLSRYDLMPYYAIFGMVAIAMSCITTPLGGKLCDVLGRKRLLMITGTLRLGLMFFCGIHTTPAVFSALYLASAFLSGFMLAIPLTILSDLTTTDERPRYFGYFGAITGVSLLFGILFSGIMTDLMGPFSMFFVFIPILLAAMILIGFGYQDPHAPVGFTTLDVPGCLLMTFCLGTLIAFCSFGGSLFPWVSWSSGLLLSASLLLFILFLRQEKRCADPLIDLHIFRDRHFVLSFACGLLIAPMVNLCSGYLVFFGQVALGLSSAASSTLAMPKNILYLAIPSFLGAWISRDTGRYRVVFLTCGGLIALAGALCALWDIDTRLLTIYAVMLLFGLATSCQSVSLQPYMQLTVPPAHIGVASSLISFSTTLGSTLIGVVNTVYFNTRYTISRNVPADLQAVMSDGQLQQLIAPDTLKNADRLAALRADIPTDFHVLFDQSVLNLRAAGADIFRLMAIITAAAGLAIVFLTLFLYRRTDAVPDGSACPLSEEDRR